MDVVAYSKPGCCLCDEAKEKLRRLQASYAFNLREVNILEDPEAHEKFKEEILVHRRGRPRACPLQGAHKGRPYVDCRARD